MLHYNLLVTSQEWVDIIKDRDNDTWDGFNKSEFFEHSIQTLAVQGLQIE